ncbi:DUF4123 domain-containing protein [Myxococcus sp. RHSTA-1-4]|uniref:DUF4123 domain-containing protein n=1 Tax=Myxococcus sp. RHSTA-1-4 TaxID=2874601 RepID=UPI001CBA99D3|nr:DUF4123 domain-containing protein [Myxococcus sp. RHSTA-1-4]MBZ4417710.1 DUF4123 domain-containing protein [Myxococcus sp. RHSTA-1-4]
MTPPSSAAPSVDRVMELLWRPPEPLEPPFEVYAVLDGARSPAVTRTLMSWTRGCVCLYEGAVPRELLAVAPYLVQLSRDADNTRELLERAWGQSWGIFAAASASLGELRRHFRKFLQVEDESGRRLYFRYYDPRVLRVYLPTCNLRELRTFFGPVSRFLAESPRGESLLEYALGPEGLEERGHGPGDSPRLASAEANR